MMIQWRVNILLTLLFFVVYLILSFRFMWYNIVINEGIMDRYNDIIKSRKKLAIIFTLILLVGIALIVTGILIPQDISLYVGIGLGVVGFYGCPLSWASTQNGRVVDETILKAVYNEKKYSFNELRLYMGGDTQAIIKKLEKLSKQGCFNNFVYDRTYGLREKGADGKAIVATKNVGIVGDSANVSMDKVNMNACQNCGASIDGMRECPYCGTNMNK